MTIRREKVAFFLVTKRTTAGERGTFAYDKLVETAIWSYVRPWESMILGGTWRVPVMEGLLDRDFANRLKESATYSPQSYNREYEYFVLYKSRELLRRP